MIRSKKAELRAHREEEKQTGSFAVGAYVLLKLRGVL